MTDIPESILTISHLSNSYSGKPLLQDVSFKLERGDILCLLGQSGSGKTTLLRLIAGLELVETGTIYFMKQDICNIPPHKRPFGMMFQEYALFPHKNVAENISFGLEMKKIKGRKKKIRVEEMLDLVGLSGFEKRRINELSGGEQQRVALARSLAPAPKLLLLDEPLGSLDRGLRDRLAGDIRTILKSLDLTAIFVTHDQTEAFSIADKIGVLQEGKLEQIDRPEQLYRQPKNSKISNFLGFSNIISGTVNYKTGLFKSQLGDFHLGQRTLLQEKQAFQAQKTSLLIRPEGSQLSTTAKDARSRTICLTGVVTSSCFLGSSYKVSFLTNGIALTFELPLEPSPPAPGGHIEISVPISSLVLLEN